MCFHNTSEIIYDHEWAQSAVKFLRGGGWSIAMRYVMSQGDKEEKLVFVCKPEWWLSLWIVLLQGDALADEIYSPEGKWFYFVVAKIAMW